MHVRSVRIHEQILALRTQAAARARAVRTRVGPGDCPAEDAAPPAPRVQQMIDRRLQIAHLGLAELRALLRAGKSGDAEVILDKLDEDLSLLRRRLREEACRA